mgnify:CR=1 FL=1
MRALYNVPFIISETGAEGIYEWSRNATAAPWTTGYQVTPNLTLTLTLTLT